MQLIVYFILLLSSNIFSNSISSFYSKTVVNTISLRHTSLSIRHQIINPCRSLCIVSVISLLRLYIPVSKTHSYYISLFLNQVLISKITDSLFIYIFHEHQTFQQVFHVVLYEIFCEIYETRMYISGFLFGLWKGNFLFP